MTQDEIIDMARQVGLVIDGNQSGFDDLEAFAKLVAAKDREACAKTLESISNAPDMQKYATAIRARAIEAKLKERNT
jgi:hypothetical protein